VPQAVWFSFGMLCESKRTQLQRRYLAVCCTLALASWLGAVSCSAKPREDVARARGDARDEITELAPGTTLVVVAGLGGKTARAWSPAHVAA
jgi:hypothetical protein